MTRTFLVVGCGSIGTRHLVNLRRLRAGRLLAADVNDDRRAAACKASGATPVASLEDGLDESPDAVLVCTPPVDHVATGLKALRYGAHLFVEKPLSHDVGQARRLVAAARRRRRILRVGYNLRLEPGLLRLAKLLADGRLGQPVAAVAEFGQYLPEWRPTRDYRSVYTARRALGGGILLDASHEIDAVRHLLGQPARVYARLQRAPHLKADAEGIADLVLGYRHGLSANLHLDFVQHGYERRLKVVGTRGTALWDFGKRTLAVRAPLPAKERVTRLPADPNAMYLEEMRDFLACLSGADGRIPDGADALDTLRVVAAAQRSARAGREVRV